jgi:DNA-binding MarR family transcriptional regulator
MLAQSLDLAQMQDRGIFYGTEAGGCLEAKTMTALEFPKIDGLTWEAWRMLNLISECSAYAGYIECSQQWIADSLGLSRKTVWRSARKLVDLGLLEVSLKPNSCARYSVKVSPPDGTALFNVSPPDGTGVSHGVSPPDGTGMGQVSHGVSPPDGTGIFNVSPPDGTGVSPPDGTFGPSLYGSRAAAAAAVFIKDLNTNTSAAAAAQARLLEMRVPLAVIVKHQNCPELLVAFAAFLRDRLANPSSPIRSVAAFASAVLSRPEVYGLRPPTEPGGAWMFDSQAGQAEWTAEQSARAKTESKVRQAASFRAKMLPIWNALDEAHREEIWQEVRRLNTLFVGLTREDPRSLGACWRLLEVRRENQAVKTDLGGEFARAQAQKRKERDELELQAKRSPP